VELVKRVLLDVQLLQVRNADLDFFVGTHVADFHVHDVFAVGVDLSVNGLFALLHCFIVLFLGLFLLLDDAFNSFVTELGHELVNAGFGIDGKAELDFQELLSRVEVLLFKGNAGKTIRHFDVIGNVFQRHCNMSHRL
jgi:hypothetical protein